MTISAAGKRATKEVRKITANTGVIIQGQAIKDDQEMIKDKDEVLAKRAKREALIKKLTG